MPKSFLVKKSKLGIEETKQHTNCSAYHEDNGSTLSANAAFPISPETAIFVQLNNGYMHSITGECLHPNKEDMINEGQSMTSPESTQTVQYPLFQHPHHIFGQVENYDACIVVDGRTKKHSIENSLRQRFRCDECGKDYATSSNLSRHKQTHRSLDSQLAKKCPHCDKVYVSMPALSMHILTHTLKHVCEICGKSFSRPWLLRGHVRSHSGHKPFGCSHCGKAFADRSNLRAHMNTHSAFKQFKCQYCSKTFALKSYLNKHYESMCLK